MRLQTSTKSASGYPPVPGRGPLGRPWLLALICWPLVLAACGQEPTPPPDVYTSRGIIRQLPAPGVPKPEIFIQHEAIADFRDQDGEMVGMESMAMPFPIDASATWDDLKVGDKVAFTFEVQWHDGHPLRMTQWQPLSADTKLGFELPPEEVSEDPMIEDPGTDEAPSDGAAGGEETSEEPTPEP